MFQIVFALYKLHYLIFILQFKYKHFAKCWKHKDTVRLKQVPLFVTVLLLSANHEKADCTVYGDKCAVMTVKVTRPVTANPPAILDLFHTAKLIITGQNINNLE